MSKNEKITIFVILNLTKYKLQKQNFVVIDTIRLSLFMSYFIQIIVGKISSYRLLFLIYKKKILESQVGRMITKESLYVKQNCCYINILDKGVLCLQ